MPTLHCPDNNAFVTEMLNEAKRFGLRPRSRPDLEAKAKAEAKFIEAEQNNVLIECLI